MRLNVYREELGPAAEVVSTTAETGKKYHGARLYLHSPSELHDDPNDDDRSAVTVWLGSPHACEVLVEAFNDALHRAGIR